MWGDSRREGDGEVEGANHHTVMWRGSVVYRRASFSFISAGPSWMGNEVSRNTVELNPLWVPSRIPPPPLHVFTLPSIKDASVFSVSFEQPTDPKLLSLVTQAVTWHFMHIADLCKSFVFYVWLSCSSNYLFIIHSFILLDFQMRSHLVYQDKNLST